MFFSKYSSILLILLSLISCKNRDYNLNDSDNMTQISNIKEVYATGIPQRVIPFSILNQAFEFKGESA